MVPRMEPRMVPRMVPRGGDFTQLKTETVIFMRPRKEDGQTAVSHGSLHRIRTWGRALMPRYRLRRSRRPSPSNSLLFVRTSPAKWRSERDCMWRTSTVNTQTMCLVKVLTAAQRTRTAGRSAGKRRSTDTSCILPQHSTRPGRRQGAEADTCKRVPCRAAADRCACSRGCSQQPVMHNAKAD
jgi:hypothetical protein